MSDSIKNYSIKIEGTIDGASSLDAAIRVFLYKLNAGEIDGQVSEENANAWTVFSLHSGNVASKSTFYPLK